MNTESGLPGHSINEGYPFDKIVTAEAMPHRLDCKQGPDGRVLINWDASIFGAHETMEELKDFLIHRLFDYSEALKISEDQIRSLLDEMPFMPEEFNFVLIHAPDGIHDSPVRLYQSKFNPEYSLYREVGNPNDENWDASRWMLLKKEGDNVFKPIPVLLPCHRIAYALFYALGIQIKPTAATGLQEVTAAPYVRKSTDEILTEAESKNTDQNEAQTPNPPVAENPFQPTSKERDFGSEILFDVVYNRPGQYPPVSYTKISALDEKDAITKAKFLIETDRSMPEGFVAEFENFIATKSQ